MSGEDAIRGVPVRESVRSGRAARVSNPADERATFMRPVTVGETIRWWSPLFGTPLEGVVLGTVEDNGQWIVIERHPYTHRKARIMPSWVIHTPVATPADMMTHWFR